MKKLVSTQHVFASVKSMLSSYDSAGLIEDSSLFNWTRYIINQLGTYSYRERSILIEICNHSNDLPLDFHLLQAAYVCNVECKDQGGTYRAYMTTPQIYTIQDNYSMICNDKCDVCYNDDMLVVKRVITKEFTVPERRIVSRLPMAIDRNLTRAKCDPCCINLNVGCEHTFNLTEDKIYTNFSEGNVMLNYYALPIDEDGFPMVYDEPLVEQAVEDYLIYKCLQKIYYNNQGDVQQRMQYAEQKSLYSMKEMIYFAKTPTFRGMVEASKKRQKTNDIFHISSSSDYNKPMKHARVQHGLTRY